MTIHYSVQQTSINASPRVMLRPNEMGGRVRIAWFEFTCGTTAPATGELIALTTLPKGARILGGVFAHNDLSDVGNSTIAIGDGVTADKYVTATAVHAAAAVFEFAHTIALYLGQLLAAETTLWATVGTANLTVGRILKGYVLYAVD